MDKEVVSKFVKVSIWEVSGRQGVMYIGFIERETIPVKDPLHRMEGEESGIDPKRFRILKADCSLQKENKTKIEKVAKFTNANITRPRRPGLTGHPIEFMINLDPFFGPLWTHLNPFGPIKTLIVPIVPI